MAPKPSTYLEAAKAALEATKRAMSSREISHYVNEHIDFPVSGKTPWKTINARISAEILENGERSTFIRVAEGRFALREWPRTVEYTAPRRKINPIDELIAVVPREQFLKRLKARSGSKLYDIDYIELFQVSQSMQRLEAEKTDDFVQLIPLFFVRQGNQFLTYKRTKRLPEKRLHGTRSINFGGHLQVGDFPTLFASDEKVVQQSLQRELREELQFSPDRKSIDFFGAIHDQTNMFGRQHVGIVFEVTSKSYVSVDTNEPGFLASLTFLTKDEIFAKVKEFDDWTSLVLSEHGRR